MEKQKNQKYLVAQPSFNDGEGYDRMTKAFNIRFFLGDSSFNKHYFSFHVSIPWDGIDKKFFRFSKDKSIELRVEFWNDLPNFREIESAYKALKAVDAKYQKVISQGYVVRDFRDIIFLLKTMFRTDEFYSYNSKVAGNVEEDTYQIEAEIRKLDDTWEEKIKECFPEDNAEVAI